jgi:hypothetical protein
VSNDPEIQELHKRQLSRSVLQGYLLAVIRSLFLRAKDIDDPFLRQTESDLQMASTYVWRPEDQEGERVLTGLTITSMPKNLQDLATATLLPAIRVGTGAMQVMPRPIVGTGPQFSNRLPGPDRNGKTQNEQYALNASFSTVVSFISGTTPVVILSQEPGEAAAIGDYIWLALVDLAPTFRRDLGLDRFVVGPLMPPGQLAGGPSNGPAVIPFIVEWSFQRTVQITEEAPLIQQISATANPTTRSQL